MEQTPGEDESAYSNQDAISDAGKSQSGRGRGGGLKGRGDLAARGRGRGEAGARGRGRGEAGARGRGDYKGS